MADDLELDRLSDESSLELDELSMADDLELDRLSDESSLELDEFSMADDLELDRLSDESSLELDEFSMADDLELDRLLDESTASDSLDDLDLELDDSLESLKELGGLDNLLNNSQKLAISAPALVEIRTPLKESSSPAPAKANTFDQTMRVSVRKLDNLNNLIGELVVKRNRLEEDQKRIRRFMDNLLSHVQSLGDMGSKMHDLYERSLLEGALIASRQQSQSSSSKSRSSFLEEGEEEPQNDNELDALELDRFTGFHLLSQDIIELIVRVREAASDIQFVVDETDKVTQSLRQATSQLQDGMNSSRMIPFGQTTDRLPRAIRDISRQLHKQVELQVEGKDVLIDKMIVENLYNPMTHLVNNAITHGIESPEKRIKSGKSVTGTLSIRAFLQGNQTVIAIADDGAGIDPERVKAKAVEKNLLTWAQAQNLSKQEVYDLIFHPGFSTQDQADDFAGRGVGMDVVSTDLKKIRGTIGIESKVGKGTIFTIRLPLVLSICKAISCVFNNTRIAFPLDGVEAQKEFAPSEIQTNENGVKQIPWNNTLLPFQPLSNLLSYNRQIKRGGVYNLNKDDDTISVIVLRSADNLLAVEVDQIIGEQEIVIKQIEGPAPKPAGIAGATVLGDGIIMPIADVLELIEIAQGKRTIELGFNIWQDKQDQQKQEAVHTEPTVLVVDDSITVRELLTLSFNKLGYRVEQAKDGQEGWDKLRGGLPCDMIFCDIEMPRMNGLELLSNLQKEDNLKRIPVAMLTSRGADKHRQLATDLGAKAYLTKPYTEKDLMDVAQKLIEINRVNREAELMVVNSNTQFDDDGDNSVTIKPKSESLVLIIDDSVTVRELLSMTFKKAGYQVEKARDGQEAWEKLRDGLECDIAFCDIEMPRMNGLELLSNLQQHEVLSSLPIAMLTSRGAQKMRNIAAQRGARGYFVKPYVEETLLDAAEKMMKGEVLIEQTDLGDSN
ncbi:Chemotaxis protein histidine kinase-like protein [Hyella patelloides LEGE 07179]|uniref:histidine kinase n=1 Tax=Hyella patelloides LEGE 07179 TaxID=945734 RepID=A0A563VL90_9CYAN|nr:hybrid sensor histidine kinase/response regulator [Hyella patelloides]VEP12117.1 Chemotaxis protein histidine kinase-like protein [Hyella patelloides LEGE 07179]